MKTMSLFLHKNKNFVLRSLFKIYGGDEVGCHVIDKISKFNPSNLIKHNYIWKGTLWYTIYKETRNEKQEGKSKESKNHYFLKKKMGLQLCSRLVTHVLQDITDSTCGKNTSNQKLQRILNGIFPLHKRFWL